MDVSLIVKNWLKTVYERFLKIRGEPREIALGLALGIMVGMTPFMGIHTLIAVPLAALLKWSKITAAAGVFITNPFTAPAIYPVTYMVGRYFTGMSSIPNVEKMLSLNSAVQLIKDAPLILVDLVVGGIIIGLPLSLAAYWLALGAIKSYRAKLKPKLEHRRKRQHAAKAASKPIKQSRKRTPSRAA